MGIGAAPSLSSATHSSTQSQSKFVFFLGPKAQQPAAGLAQID
jgi:hypothetical protein